jgi:hypothetical protein
MVHKWKQDGTLKAAGPGNWPLEIKDNHPGGNELLGVLFKDVEGQAKRRLLLNTLSSTLHVLPLEPI